MQSITPSAVTFRQPVSSPYVFAAWRQADCPNTTVLECVAPSPPHRVRGVRPTVTRLFKRQGISLTRLKGKKKDTGVVDRENAAGPSTSRRAATPQATPAASLSNITISTPSSSQTEPVDDGEDITIRESSPESALSSVPSSPPSSPSLSSFPTIPAAVARARSPEGLKTPRLNAAPYHKPSGVRLTQSASRSSLKAAPSSSKMEIKSVMAAIDRRLASKGGIATRYGERDGEPIFIRQERVTSTTEPDVVTFFWESFTAVPLRQPPDMKSYPDLTVGDVYINILRNGSKDNQMWIWTSGSDGAGYWKRAREGDVREDGRRLMVTPRRQQPSWVSAGWGMKQLRKTRT